MSTPFLGEIRRISWNYAPKGWHFCDGTLLQINQNQALFSILGTTYGGNGQTTFGLPDLRSRVPMHPGTSHILGEVTGVESVTLTSSQIPAHNHTMAGLNIAGTSASPSGKLPAQASLSTGAAVKSYAASGNLTPMAPLAIGLTGGAQPHDNIAPYLCINYVIALQGIFPSRN